MKKTAYQVPVTYRLRADQDEWLRKQSLLKGHGRKSLILRDVIDEAMASKRKTAAVSAA